MPQLTSDQRGHLDSAIRWFKDRYLTDRYQAVRNRLPSVRLVATLQSIHQETEELYELFFGWPQAQLLEVPERLIPCLKRVLIAYRRYEANQAESLKAFTNNSDFIQSLENRVSPLDDLLREPWFEVAEPTAMPRIAELLSIQALEENPRGEPLAPREYDEKFHILQSPKLFIKDLNHYRCLCEERGATVIAAYIDIDDFKAKFNTPYSETQVDRRVLPLFMQALDAHVFQHGFAYRQGGDEYLLLLPNLSRHLGISFLDALRLNLSQLEYRDIGERTTVSIGFCCVDPDSYLTDREIEELANRAKNFAKSSGKNCIATYSGTGFEDGDLFVVTPQTA
jgi:diguanylate cyclase (GGDEF)-like protein